MQINPVAATIFVIVRVNWLPARIIIIGELYRSIWISGLHLGTRACKADILLDFLQHNKAENLYLVGDIIDGWNLGPSWYWSSAQNEVVEEVASWHRQGARVVFLPGNHDEPHTALVESLFGLIRMVPELVHRTAEGRRMLVIHSHQLPGPGSISEALVMGLPVIVERDASTMVQERYNTEWLLQTHLGIVLRSFGEIAKGVAAMLNPEQMARFRGRVNALNNQAVFEIPEMLDALIAQGPDQSEPRALENRCVP